MGVRTYIEVANRPTSKMDEFLTHLPDFHVVVCKKYQYAVLPSQIDAHYMPKKPTGSKKVVKRPHGLDKVTRDRIKKDIAKIEGLIPNPEVLKQCPFIFPPATARPIPALAQPQVAIRCRFPVQEGECGYICCSSQQIQNHCTDDHQWKNTESRGRPRKARVRQIPSVPWETGIHCQRFFPQGPKSQYFEVQPVPTRPPPTPRITSRKSQFDAAKQEMQRAFKKAEEEEERQIKETDEAKEPSPWLKRVGCIPHLASVDRKEARELVEPVDEREEPHLAILCTAFEWLIQDAQHHAVREVVGLQTLFEANKKEVDRETNMPFDSWMDITTVERYVEVWRQLLLFVFRAEEDDVDKRPPYVLTSTQQIAMQAVRDKIQAFQEWKQEQQKSTEDDDQGGDEGFGSDDEQVDAEEDGGLYSGLEDVRLEDSGLRGDDERADEEVDEGFEDGMSKEEVEWIGQIQREVLRFCIALLDHPLQDNEYESAIISGLAVLMIKNDNGWHDAEDFTTKYSAVIKLARLMVVQDAYERREEQIRRYQSQDTPEAAARKQARSYYSRVKESVSRFMTMAHDGRDPTPMQWIYQTRSYGFKIRYTTPAAGKIQWIREEVLYPGTRIEMSQLRSMVHGLIGEARDALFGKLMMVDSTGGKDPPQVPPIDWENTVDQPSETKVGWSFLDDERNKFGAHKEWWLFERMYQEQALRE